MSSDEYIYGIRSNGLNHGDVFTSLDVVRFMLDAVGYTSEKDLSNVYILEPSFGNGEFLLEMQHRISQSAKRFGFDSIKAFQKCIFGCELDESKVKTCIERLRVSMPNYTPKNLKNEDFLFSEWNRKFDFIVGNPPYVRYENIPEDLRRVYKRKFYTFHYRCDLYVLFYEHSLGLLKKGGKHCFICSNRWLKNEYGKKLRSLIANTYNLAKLVDIEKLQPFKESVLAYPIISLIENCLNKGKIELATPSAIQDLNDTLQYEQKQYYDYQDLSSIFFDGSQYNFPTIEEQNFSIGIGVATGADHIFISNNFIGKIEAELLLPIISAKDLSGNLFKYHGLCLLNPYDQTGRLVDLNLYPKAKSYLESHKMLLQKRNIVKNNRPWYALIDRVKPNLEAKTKILLPDISANTRIFVDEGNYYPSHNIYYITSDCNPKEYLIILAAILMSDFVRNQVRALSNNMNGGFPRWQSQVIKKLRIPEIDSITSDCKKQLLYAYKNFDVVAINQIVTQIISVPIKKVSRKSENVQLSLFTLHSHPLKNKQITTSQ